MLNFFKNIFSKKEEEKVEPDRPGRTFNRIVTSRYFGCEDNNSHADTEQIKKIKLNKIHQIRTLDLLPKFIRYTYFKNSEKIQSAHVVFQKETTSQRGNMIHVSELAFIIREEDFNEFEKMTNLSLEEDFRDLTDFQYNGKERRKETRES